MLDFKAEIMLFKRTLIAKLIIQIGLVSVTISEPSEHSYVSKNWHKAQVFISYDIKTSNEQIIDCIGTILSPRFILTTATCIQLSFAIVPNLKDAVVTKIHVDGSLIHKYQIEKFTIHPDYRLPDKEFPDLAILKLTNDITLSDDAYKINQQVDEFYPQDSPGACKNCNSPPNNHNINYHFR